MLCALYSCSDFYEPLDRMLFRYHFRAAEGYHYRGNMGFQHNLATSSGNKSVGQCSET
jgi:hypothetical protein